MEMTRSGSAVVYVILLCVLSKGGSEGKRWNLHEFLNEDCHLSSSLPGDEIKLEQAWKHCRKELVGRNHGNENFDSHPVEGSSELRSSLVIEDTVPQAFEFLDCMSAKTFNVPIPQEKAASSPPLSTKHWTRGCERHLLAADSADSPDDQMTPSNTPPPDPPSHSSPSSSPSPSPSPSPEPASESPSDDDTNPPDSPSDDPPSDSLSDSSPPAPPHSPKQPPPKPSDHATPPPESDNNNQLLKIIFIAAVIICVIAALLLMCLCFGAVSNDEVNPKDAQKYDKPFITLASSDAFAGSQKFAGLAKSDSKESTTDSNLLANPEGSSLPETPASIEQIPPPPLKPPPGKPAPSPPEPPPPPTTAPRAPPPPPPKVKAPPMPKKPIQSKNKTEQGSSSEGGESGPPKPKLKPFFWDKVNAKGDQGMVWQQINAGSFQFNEEMIESLFGCANANQKKKERKRDAPLEPTIQYIKLIDPRKAQNLSILLKALNVTSEEVIDALKEASEIPVEIIHTLLRMALTTDEELKLRLYTGDLNLLGPAERFLKVMIDIPFAFKRLESLTFMSILAEEVSTLKDNFKTLEVACDKLTKSRLFLKLLEAVLKTGNRMNDGTYRGGAQAFKLDTLLKLSDVKGTDGKTTLLHFVVQEIIRSEGIRAVRTQKANNSSGSSVDFLDDANEETTKEHYRSLGLQVVSGLSDELEDVKKAAVIDGEGLTSTVSKLGQSLLKSKEFLNNEMKELGEDSEFHHSLKCFVEKAEEEIKWLLEEEKRIMALVKSAADYFHGTAGKDEGLRLFAVVRDFLRMLDKACEEVQDTTMPIKSVKASNSKKETPTVSSVPETRPPQDTDIHRRLFPAIAERRMDFSDSDDESSSP